MLDKWTPLSLAIPIPRPSLPFSHLCSVLSHCYQLLEHGVYNNHFYQEKNDSKHKTRSLILHKTSINARYLGSIQAVWGGTLDYRCICVEMVQDECSLMRWWNADYSEQLCAVSILKKKEKPQCSLIIAWGHTHWSEGNYVFVFFFRYCLTV
jgi:NADH:ubiquinone oxidoreductase subunit